MCIKGKSVTNILTVDKNHPEIQAIIEQANYCDHTPCYLVNCGESIGNNIWWLCKELPVWQSHWQPKDQYSEFLLGHYDTEDIQYLPEICSRVPLKEQVFRIV